MSFYFQYIMLLTWEVLHVELCFKEWVVGATHFIDRRFVDDVLGSVSILQGAECLPIVYIGW